MLAANRETQSDFSIPENCSRNNSHFVVKKNIKRLIFFSVLVLFFNSVLFTYYNANPLVKSDGWRFIQIYLIPWLNGTLSWVDLWRDHHPQPITAVFFLLNAIIFDLRMDYEALFAVSFSFLSVIVSWRLYKSNVEMEEFDVGKLVFILLTAALLCSLTSVVVYSWSLVTLGYIFIFFALFSLLAIDHITRSRVTPYKFIFCALYVLLLLLLYSEQAKILLYACVVTLFLSFLFAKEVRFLIPMSIIILCIIIQIIFMNFVGIESSYNETGCVFSVFDRVKYLPEYFFYIGIGLLSAWGNIAAIARMTGVSQAVIFVFGNIIFMAYLYTLYLYFRNGLYRKSIVPGALIITAILTGLGAAIFRFKPDVQSAMTANVPRYYLYYSLGIIGTSWVWCMCLQDKKEGKRAGIVIFIIMFVVFFSQALSFTVAWDSTRYRKKAFRNSYEIMLKNASGDLSVKPPVFMVGNNYPEPYLTGLQLLKVHKLNLFSKNVLIKKNE